MIAVPEETRLNNIRENIERDLPSLHVRLCHDWKFIICAGGPSLKDEIGKIKSLQKRGGKIVAVNGVYNYLLSKKIIPDIFIMSDQKEGNYKFVSNPKKETVFFIALDCDPSVFNALKGYDVRTWVPIEYDLPMLGVGGGSTVTLRSLSIGYILGFRDFHLFGFDGSVKKDHHAYPQPDNDNEDMIEVDYNGKRYKMTNWMISQAQDFEEYIRMYKDFKLKIHTNGLMKDIYHRHEI